MCLVKAFVGTWSEQPILQDIAHLRIDENTDKIELETLFGKEQTVWGRIVEIDFTTSKILLKRMQKMDDREAVCP